MGVPDRTVLYENCGPAAHNHWSPATPVSLTTTSSQPQQQLQQQQQQQQQYERVPPPPYPGHSKHVFSNLPGYRQSYSGSDTSTDMSLSSTENLASWPRQEPQGEESLSTSLPQPSLDNSSFNLLTRLQGMCSVAESPNGSLERLSASPVHVPCSASFSSSSGHSQTASATSTSSGGEDLSSSGGGSGPLRQRLAVPHAWQGSQDVPPPHSARYFRSLTPTYHHPHPYVNQNWTVGEGGVVSDPHAPSSQVVTYVPFLPPPPEYPGHKDRKEGGRACVGRAGQGRCLSDPVRCYEGGASRVQHKDSGVCQGHQGSYVSSDTIFSALKPGSPRSPGGSQGSADHVVNVLNEQNRRLQEELVHCYKKIAKLQKLEQEIQQVQEAYQSLVRSTDKRERLEAAIKGKLQEEVKKLQSQHEELKGQLQKAGPTRKLRSRSEGRGTQREKESAANLRQHLSEQHHRVEQLESEIEQWEQRYSELQGAQRAGRSSQSSWCECPSGVVKSSQKMAQRLAEAQNDEQQHAEQLSQSQGRVTELEAKVSWLQNQLAEKEEVLKTYGDIPPPSPEDPSSPQSHPSCLSPSHSTDESYQNSGGQQCPASPKLCQNRVQFWQV